MPGMDEDGRTVLMQSLTEAAMREGAGVEVILAAKQMAALLSIDATLEALLETQKGRTEETEYGLGKLYQGYDQHPPRSQG